MSDWKDYYSDRPTEAGYYWFRVPGKKLSSSEFVPEWISKVCLHGMGWGPAELYPVFSKWDGDNRSIPEKLQWKENSTNQTGKHNFLDILTLPDLNLCNCPFCDNIPIIIYGRPGALYSFAPFNAEYFRIKCIVCQMLATPSSIDLSKLITLWNRRF